MLNFSQVANWKSSARKDPLEPSRVPNSEASTSLARFTSFSGEIGNLLWAIVFLQTGHEENREKETFYHSIVYMYEYLHQKKNVDGLENSEVCHWSVGKNCQGTPHPKCQGQLLQVSLWHKLVHCCSVAHATQSSSWLECRNSYRRDFSV